MRLLPNTKILILGGFLDVASGGRQRICREVTNAIIIVLALKSGI